MGRLEKAVGMKNGVHVPGVLSRLRLQKIPATMVITNDRQRGYKHLGGFQGNLRKNDLFVVQALSKIWQPWWKKLSYGITLMINLACLYARLLVTLPPT